MLKCRIPAYNFVVFMASKRFIEQMTKKAEKAGMLGEGFFGIDAEDIEYAFRNCNRVQTLAFKANKTKNTRDNKLKNPREIKGMLIHIGYEKGVEASHCHKIVEAIGERLNPNTKMIWSATLQKTPKVRILAGK